MVFCVVGYSSNNIMKMLTIHQFCSKRIQHSKCLTTPANREILGPYALRLGEVEIHLGSTNQGTRCLHLVLNKSVKVPGHFVMIIPVKITGQEENFFWRAVGPVYKNSRRD